MAVSQSLIKKRQRSLDVLKRIGEKLNDGMTPNEASWLRDSAKMVIQLKEEEHKKFQLDCINQYGECLALRLLKELK